MLKILMISTQIKLITILSKCKFNNNKHKWVTYKTKSLIWIYQIKSLNILTFFSNSSGNNKMHLININFKFLQCKIQKRIKINNSHSSRISYIIKMICQENNLLKFMQMRKNQSAFLSIPSEWVANNNHFNAEAYDRKEK